MYTCPNCKGIQLQKPSNGYYNDSRCWWCLKVLTSQQAKNNRRSLFAGGIDMGYTIAQLSENINMEKIHEEIAGAETEATARRQAAEREAGRGLISTYQYQPRIGRYFVFMNSYYMSSDIRRNLPTLDNVVTPVGYREERSDIRRAEVRSVEQLKSVNVPVLPTYIPRLLQFIDTLDAADMAVWAERRFNTVHIPVKFKGAGPAMIRLLDVLYYWKRRGDLNFTTAYPGYMESLGSKMWSTLIYQNSPDGELFQSINDRYIQEVGDEN